MQGTGIRVHAFTEVGGHRINEDAYCVRAHPDEPSCWLCIVADGQGGQRGGGPAARLACERAFQAACRRRPTDLIDPSTWPTILREADQVVQADPESGYTTLVGLCAYQTMVAGASCGDSAALLVLDRMDHHLTSGQRKNPPVGCGAASPVPFSASVLPPWKLLVMTDGVWKYAGWERVVEIAKRANGENAIRELRAAAGTKESDSLQDDFTLVVLECASTDQ